jgi:SAM-dependent methyltransferase
VEAEKYHEHYRLQAQWLSPARHYLYRRAELSRRQRILDLGCGSGVIGEEIRQITGRTVLGADRDPGILEFARERYPRNRFLAADERGVLASGQRFDLVVLSFVLMWQRDPLPFLKRVRKLLRPEGLLLVLAEPDYGGRVDFPAELDFLKDIFIGHVRQGGGDPFIGRRLASLLRHAGFQASVELASCLDFPRGCAGGAWEREWEFWQELAGFSTRTRKRIQRLERAAAASRERLVLFPVFCALAGSL